MSQPIQMTNVKIEMQASLDTAKTITGITKASTGVATSTAHGYTNGDVVVLAIAGMVELDGRAVRVANVTTNTFELEGVDTSSYTTFVSGTAKEVLTWSSFSNVQGFSFPEPQPTKEDTTTVHDTQKQQVFGLDEAPQITMSLRADPLDTTIIALRAASIAKTARVFRVTTVNGYKLIFNSYVAGGRGLDGGTPGAIATGQAYMTMINTESWFAS
jgi:hypothetical protein